MEGPEDAAVDDVAKLFSQCKARRFDELKFYQIRIARPNASKTLSCIISESVG